jgi:hypothetical protein
MATWFDLSLVNGQTLIDRFNAIATALGLKAPLASPTFTGTVTAPTFAGALTGNASTATTAAKVANALTRGTHLTGSNYDGAAATTWAVDATNLNTASKVVARDASGNFAAGTITASLTGNVTGNVGATTVTASGTVTAARYATTAGATLTIAAGVVTVTNGIHAVETEGAAATDDLDTVNGGVAGMILILRAVSSVRDVVLKDGTGNLRLAGDFTLTSTDDRIILISDGVNWAELSRSDNAA